MYVLSRLALMAAVLLAGYTFAVFVILFAPLSLVVVPLFLLARLRRGKYDRLTSHGSASVAGVGELRKLDMVKGE